jgi:hypothetical protein
MSSHEACARCGGRLLAEYTLEYGDGVEFACLACGCLAQSTAARALAEQRAAADKRDDGQRARAPSIGGMRL